jgi:hypothetical protein
VLVFLFKKSFRFAKKRLGVESTTIGHGSRLGDGSDELQSPTTTATTSSSNATYDVKIVKMLRFFLNICFTQQQS